MTSSAHTAQTALTAAEASTAIEPNATNTTQAKNQTHRFQLVLARIGRRHENLGRRVERGGADGRGEVFQRLERFRRQELGRVGRGGGEGGAGIEIDDTGGGAIISASPIGFQSVDAMRLSIVM